MNRQLGTGCIDWNYPFPESFLVLQNFPNMSIKSEWSIRFRIYLQESYREIILILYIYNFIFNIRRKQDITQPM